MASLLPFIAPSCVAMAAAMPVFTISSIRLMLPKGEIVQSRRNLGVAAEVVDVLQLALRRLDRLAEQGEGLERRVEPFFSFLQAVLQQHLGIRSTRAVIKFGGVDGNGVLDLLEEVLVVDDVTE